MPAEELVMLVTFKDRSMNTPLSIWNSRYQKMHNDVMSLKHDYWIDRWQLYLERSNKGTVLDIGCGIGLDPIYLTEKGYSVILIDLSDEALSICKQSLPNMPYLQVDLREGLSFSKDSFHKN